jgi:hypothetical protein
MDSVKEGNSLVRLELEQGHWYRSAAGELFILPDKSVHIAEFDLETCSKVVSVCHSSRRAVPV